MSIAAPENPRMVFSEPGNVMSLEPFSSSRESFLSAVLDTGLPLSLYNQDTFPNSS
jgi:hypothetical protein